MGFIALRIKINIGKFYSPLAYANAPIEYLIENASTFVKHNKYGS